MLAAGIDKLLTVIFQSLAIETHQLPVLRYVHASIPLVSRRRVCWSFMVHLPRRHCHMLRSSSDASKNEPKWILISTSLRLSLGRRTDQS